LPNPNSIRMGGAYIELFAETGPLAKGLRKALGIVKTWSAGLQSADVRMASLGTAGVAGFLATAKAAADAGGELDDMSQRTGASIESLSGLKYAAEQSGTSLDGVEAGIKKLSTNLADAKAGNEAARKSFERLGLSWEHLHSLPVDEQFIAISDALSAIESPGERAAATMDVLGKSGIDLLPLMNSGASGIRALVEEARELGLVMTSKDAKQAAEFGDKLDKVFAVARSAVIKLGSAVIPVLEPFVVMLAKGAAIVGKWIDENRGMVAVAVSAAGALAILGAGLASVGGFIGVVVWFGGLAISALSALAGAVAFLAPLFTPLGLALAAGIGFLAGTVNWSNVLKSSLEWLGGGWKVLQDETTKALGAMGAALTAGNLTGAVAVLWSYLELQWLKGKVALIGVWDSMIDGIVSGWSVAVRFIAGAGIGAWGAIQKAWINASNLIKDTTTILVSSWQMLWIRAIAYIETAIVKLWGYFDKSINVKVRVDEIHNRMAGKNNAILDSANSSLGRSVNDKRLSEIDQSTQDMIDSLAGSTANGESSALKRAKDDLKAAQEEFEKTAQAALESGKATAKTADTNPSADSAISTMQGSSVIGSFSPFGIDGTGAFSLVGLLTGKIDEVKQEVAGLRTDGREQPRL
jgi:hypothetical protein